jgi:hypothetical protein
VDYIREEGRLGSEWQNTRCIILFVISKLYEENIMKKYLFGLGAMLIGAGLMFVFPHTEVSAESEASKPESFVCSDYAEGENFLIAHCETKTIHCAVIGIGNISCVKSGGLFK